MTSSTIVAGLTQDTAFGSLESALKIWYKDVRIAQECYKGHPFLGLVEKKEDIGGMAIPVPLIIAPEAAGSATFSVAQAAEAAGFTPAQFFVTLANDYQCASISTKAMLASIHDAGAFLDLAKAKIDLALHSAARRCSISCFRSADGTVAQISGSPTGGAGAAPLVVTLAARGQVVAFEVGQVYGITANKTTIVASSTYLQVSGVDRSAGTVSFVDTAAGVPNGSTTAAAAANTYWTSGNYLVPNGDIGARQAGLSDLLPPSASAPAALFGLARTTDRVRLAGCFVDGSQLSVQQTLINAGNAVAEQGVGVPTHVFINWDTYGALLSEINAKTTYMKEVSVKAVKNGQDVGVSYEGMDIFLAGAGRVTVLPDRDVPTKTGWLLDMSKMRLLSLGPAQRILSPDGLKWLRQGTADGAELRVGGFYQLITDMPAAHSSFITQY